MITYTLIISIFFWLFLTFFWGRFPFSKEPFFWSNKVLFKSSPKKNRLPPAKIKIVIPARNEEQNICTTLSKLISQVGVNYFIIIVDDNSTDSTSDITKNFFKKNRFDNFKIIKGLKLPTNWSGKIWAMKQGVEFALKDKEEFYLLFMDADISLEKNVLKSLVDKLNSEKLEMISLMAKLNCKFFWEKILIPSFIFFFQKLYPFNLVNKSSNYFAAAAGGCILTRSKIFRQQDLFEEIKNKVIDDCNLARLIKKKGKIWIGLTNCVISERKYKKLGEIWQMVSRTAFEQLNNSITILLLSLFGLMILYLLFPLILIISIFNFEILNFLLALAGYSLISVIYLPTIKFYNLSKLNALILPFSALIYIFITLNSAINYYLGYGNVWKERKY